MQPGVTFRSFCVTNAEGSLRTLYLIFSHDNQQQLPRLARAIRRLSPSALIAVHHDPRIQVLDPSLFSRIGDLHLVPNPVQAEWGDYSQVEQYLHSLRWCFDNLDFDWICTLTGLSYPINPLRDFEESLRKSGYDAFVRHFDAFDPGPYPKGVWPVGTGETRYLFRYFKLPRFRYGYRIPLAIRDRLARLRDAFNRSQEVFRIVTMPRGARTRFGVRRLNLPFGPEFKYCGGRQMLNLRRCALVRVLQFVQDNPQYEEYFKRTMCPDEGFFTSILANDPALRVCNDVCRYIKWPKAIGSSNVSVIETAELGEILKSSAPFALKFDMRIEPGALDRIDALLGLDKEEPAARSDSMAE